MKKPTSPSPEVASFRDWLAGLNDEQLSGLLQLRPDTVLPLPPGIGPLAARLQLRASVSRALRMLNTTDLLVMESVAELGGEFTPVSAPEVVELINERTSFHGVAAPVEAYIVASLAKLESFGLIYGSDAKMVVQEAMSALPSGWQLLPDAEQSPDNLTEVLESLPQRSKKILTTLAQSGGTGVTKDAALDADPARPIPQLIAQGLLHRVDESTVRLPQVVRQAMASTSPLPLTAPPAVTSGDDALAIADPSGISAGLEVCRQMRLLLQELGEHPVSTLKGGAVGVRMIGRLSKTLDATETEIARLMCLGVASDLIARGVPEPLPEDDDGGDYYAPTPRADEWVSQPLDEQLRTLLTGWHSSSWAPWLLGTTIDKSKVHLLAREMHEERFARWREQLIDALSHLPPGGAVSEPHDYVRFRYPLTTLSLSKETFAQLLDEAQWIGAVANGAVTSAMRFDRIDVPAAVEQLIVQADMTMLAPGPLTPRAQKFVDQIADVESSGLASVYRVTEASIRRALDSGLSGPDIIGQLKELSVMELPQSISYLVDDVARKHGSLRGGPAMSYLRCDDPSLIAQAVSAIGDAVALRAVAPTVAVAQAPLVQVIKALRAAGFQPIAEDAFGLSLDLAPEPSRVPQPEHRPPASTIDEGRIEAAVAAIRRGDTAKAAVSAGTRAPASETLSILQAAARAGKTVTLGFVDKHGVAVHRVVRPVTVAAGLVDAIDATTGDVHRFQVHRITEVIVQ
ncbi:helicase-associated domain-containing protein [Corynebacterium sp. H130]|uniref:helicase-associated domain-containing protein n=1 Tax=Corynebacterium sp. H130 TaxID=3133444 RepID=UPI00309A82E2